MRMATDTSGATPRGERRFGRFLGFIAVGGSGLIVNQLAFWMMTGLFGVPYMYAFLLATQFSTVWNFVLLERYVFKGGEGGRWGRLGWYALMNNIWNVASAPLMYALTSGVGVNALLSNWLVICGMTIVRFAISNNLIWGRGAGSDAAQPTVGTAASSRTGTWNYDIHGIVQIASQAPLPELVRFQVPALLGPADIEVVVSNAGFGGLRRRVEVTETEDSISYIEHLGRFGFAAKIDTDTLGRIQISKLLRRSPHVAYTNVVEPVLRWMMVRKGYILAHAACLQLDGHGVLITARTDTGKTTTCLKSIKEQGSGFVSDDMVIIDPSGFARTFPKPLTISSHTLHAIKGAPLPALTRAWLQIQGRIHSKFGRSVGLAIGNINLPVASMSAVVQMVIPPPKFQFDELVPQAPLVPTLQLHRLMLIERGDAMLRELSVEEAFEVLSENTEDAYGFPPYPRIGHALANSEHKIEADIRRQMIGNLEAVHLRTPDRNWFELLPVLASGYSSEVAERVTVGADGGLVFDLSDDNVVTMPPERRPAGALANRFEKLSPEEAEEVENALSGALTLLQKVSDILEGQNEKEPAVSGLVASVRSLRDARLPQPKD
jgi:dolichol-phosphate mannosyltransferase